MTPEGKIKKKIKKVFDNYRTDDLYVYMPVPGGYGAPTLDYIGFFRGRGFAVEAKRPGAEPTDRQTLTIDRMRAAGARVFVVNNDETLAELDAWLTTVVKESVDG